MALIQTIEPEKAEGQAKEIYDFMMENAGVIPAPLQLASASPWPVSYTHLTLPTTPYV